MIKFNCDIVSESNNIYFHCFPNKPIKEWAVITIIALTALAIGAATAISIALATPYGVFGALAFGTLAAVGTGLFLATIGAICSSPNKKLPNVSDSDSKKQAQSNQESSTSIQASEPAKEIDTFIKFTIYPLPKDIQAEVTIGINNYPKTSHIKGEWIQLSGLLGKQEVLSKAQKASTELDRAKQALTKLSHGYLSKLNLLLPKTIAKPVVIISNPSISLV